MSAALLAETVKLLRSPVGRAGTALLAVGIAVLGGAMILAARGSNPRLLAKLGDAADPSWAGLLAGAAQITGAGGLLGFGVVVGWMFGREFVEGTISGLFALPVSRATIATAKLVVYLTWAVITSAGIVVSLLAVGLAFGFGWPGPDAIGGLGRQFTLAVLTAAVATPVAWAATVGRSVLIGVVSAIGLIIATQVAVIGGVGAWSGIAAPALWAISAGADVTAVQLALVLPVMLVAAGLTMMSWKRLQLDR